MSRKTFRDIFENLVNSPMEKIPCNCSGSFRFVIFAQSALWFLILTGFFDRPAWGQQISPELQELRVLTFNIMHGATMRGDFDLDRIAAVIRDAGPDLVALQEVDFKTDRARGMDLAAELAIRTRMTSVFAGAMPFDGGEYGLAILSRWSFVHTRKVPLPGSPGKEPRIALEATTVTASGDTLRFINTHLDHTREPADRIAQAGRLVALLPESPYPSILAGDLNDVPESDAIRLLETVWTATYDRQQPQPTFPSENPRVQIDYVMVHPEERWRVMESRVIPDPVASDHCAYLVVLKRIR